MSWSLSQSAIRLSSDVTTRLPGSRFEGGRGEREGRSWLEDVSRCSGWERLDWTGLDWRLGGGRAWPRRATGQWTAGASAWSVGRERACRSGAETQRSLLLNHRRPRLRTPTRPRHSRRAACASLDRGIDRTSRSGTALPVLASSNMPTGMIRAVLVASDRKAPSRRVGGGAGSPFRLACMYSFVVDRSHVSSYL